MRVPLLLLVCFATLPGCLRCADLGANSAADATIDAALVLSGGAGLPPTVDAADATLVLSGARSESEGIGFAGAYDGNADGAPDLAVTGSAGAAWLFYGAP